MKNTKTIGIILLVVGVAILVLSLVADIIGFGGSLSFGYKQITGIIAGTIMTIAGLILMIKK